MYSCPEKKKLKRGIIISSFGLEDFQKANVTVCCFFLMVLFISNIKFDYFVFGVVSVHCFLHHTDDVVCR